MNRLNRVLKVIDKMEVKELRQVLESNVSHFDAYKNYIQLKIEEKTLIKKYFTAGV